MDWGRLAEPRKIRQTQLPVHPAPSTKSSTTWLASEPARSSWPRKTALGAASKFCGPPVGSPCRRHTQRFSSVLDGRDSLWTGRVWIPSSLALSFCRKMFVQCDTWWAMLEFWALKVDRHLHVSNLDEHERLSPFWTHILASWISRFFFLFLKFFAFSILETALHEKFYHVFNVNGGGTVSVCVWVHVCAYVHTQCTRKQGSLYVSTYPKFSLGYLRMVRKDIKALQQKPVC